MGLHWGEEVFVGTCAHFLPQPGLELGLGTNGGSHLSSGIFLRHRDTKAH